MAKSQKPLVFEKSLFSVVAEPTARIHNEGTNVIRIRKGYKWNEVKKIQSTFQIKDDTLTQIIGVSGRTLTRIKGKGTAFDAVASDRFFRLAKVLKLAAEIFEDLPSAVRWLNREQPGLGGSVPMQLLDTDPGSEQVLTLLHQLDYGVLP